MRDGRAEQTRCNAILEMAEEDVPFDLVRRALTESWDY